MSRLFSSGKPRFGLFVLTSGEKTFLLWKGKLLLLTCRRPSCSKNTGQIAMPSFLSRFPDKCSCISKRMGLIYCHLVSKNSCDRFLKLVQALLNRREIKYGGRSTHTLGSPATDRDTFWLVDIFRRRHTVQIRAFLFK